MSDFQADFPTTYRVADGAAVGHQCWHFLMKKVEYLTVVLAALFAAFPYDENSNFHWPAVVSAISLLVAIAVLLFEKTLKHHSAWYLTRAIAESIKAESWRFRAGCGQYLPSLGKDELVERFADFAKELTKSDEASKYMSQYLETGDEVTGEMLETNKKPLAERVETFKEHRAREQEKWYTDKARAAGKIYNYMFILAVILLLAGLVSALFQFANLGNEYGIIPLLSTTAASLFAWIQLRRFETLSVTYTTAANELRGLQQLLDTANNDAQKFSTLVEEVEGVISKEHSIWVQRAAVG